MPHGEEVSFTPRVKLKGAPLEASLAGALVSGYVDQSLFSADLLLLRFRDPELGLLSSSRFAIGDPIEIGMEQSGPSDQAPLFIGEVTALDFEVGADGAHLLLRGLDGVHRLQRGSRAEVYTDMKAGDIVAKIAKRAGLATGTVDQGGPIFEHLVQPACSDWDFLQLLAGQSGCTLSVRSGKLHFAKAEPADSAPAQGEPGSDPLILDSGQNLIRLHGSLTAAEQVADVEVRGWDVKAKKPISVVAKPAARTGEVSGTPFAGTVAAVNQGRHTVAMPHYDQSALAQHHADALADRLGGGFAEIEGTARGNTRLHAGRPVLLRVGAAFKARFTLTAARHEFGQGSGYQVNFSASAGSERSLLGLAAGNRASPDSGRAAVVNGLVTAIDDPEHLGRVRVMFPAYGEKVESWWARTVQAGAGKARGAVVLPEVGDEVLVGFGDGGLNQPYVLGGLYNGEDLPAEPWQSQREGSDSVRRRSFTSRTGMQVEFLESSSEQRINVATKGGKHRISLIQNGEGGIEIETSGKVGIKAGSGVEITSSAGPLSLSAPKISLEATSELLLKGATVKLLGDAMTEVKGAMVKIN